MPVYLPLELWFRIASFIPPKDLIKLIGLNRAFFEFIMDELYDQVSFISADPRVFVEKVQTLQDTFLAGRVRILTIWPSAIRDAISAHESENTLDKRSASPTPPRPQHRRNHSNIIDLGRSYVDKLLDKKANAPPSTSTREPLISSEERTTLFNDAVRQLTRVDELQIVWYLDKDRERAWKFPLFPSIWRAVGHSIKRLSMDIQVHVLAEATSTCGTLQQLEHLDLVLRKDKTLNLQHAETDIPYFVNKFAPTLHHLSIRTIGHQSLSFFSLLEGFPRLTSLGLTLPLDSYHLPDPSGIHRFLYEHPQLRSLSIRYAYCCRDCRDDGFGLPHENNRHRILTGLSFDALQSLELGLYLPIGQNQARLDSRPLSWDSPTPFLYSIARIPSHLTSLTLVDRCLTIDEVRLIISTFPTARRLKKLSLYIKKLSPQLIDLIAMSCSSLSSLVLDVETVVRSEATEDAKPQSDVDGFVVALYTFAIEEDDYRYRKWALSDISILTWEFKVGKRLNWACMRAVAGVVPTVRRFAGKEDNEEGRRPSTDSTRSRNRQAVVYMRPQDNNSTTSVGVRQDLEPLRRRMDVVALPRRFDT